jgi:hypothetical protein
LAQIRPGTAPYCVAYRAPAPGGADWKHWILHDALLGVFDASDARAVGHKMWEKDGSLAFFLRLPGEDGVTAVRRQGEYTASMFTSW